MTPDDRLQQHAPGTGPRPADHRLHGRPLYGAFRVSTASSWHTRGPPSPAGPAVCPRCSPGDNGHRGALFGAGSWDPYLKEITKSLSREPRSVAPASPGHRRGLAGPGTGCIITITTIVNYWPAGNPPKFSRTIKKAFQGDRGSSPYRVSAYTLFRQDLLEGPSDSQTVW